jgi:RNA polymerase sigma-70 factor (ECF subfamily)
MTQAMVGRAMLPSPERTPQGSAALDAERSTLWGICYRMTGSASDADDLVQEAFVRAMERPPEDTSMPWRPWLVRVVINLARDHLRRRRRRAYHGTWLPTPIDTPAAGGFPVFDAAPSDDNENPEARYGALESASFAFLVAVEALTPSQRAVLVLRDAFDYSSRETADALGVSEENVRITLHRARKAMATYDAGRVSPSADRNAAIESMLRQLVVCLASRDLAGAASLLASDARSLGDGGGVYHAAPAPVVGAAKIAKFYTKLTSNAGPDFKFEIRNVNGTPAFVGEDPNPSPPNSPRVVLLVDLDREGKICTLYSVIAPDKLRNVNWSGHPGSPEPD